MTEITKDTKIYIAGHKGMVGSACWRFLEKKGYNNLIGKSSKELDLKDQKATAQFFRKEKPQVVIDSAAKVGGIWANNQYPYEFLMDNMLIQNNLIKMAHENGVKKFIFLGSSCIYPKHSEQPIKENSLLTASLEETNQWYALAKITGVKLCEAIFTKFKKQFISLMPTNLYGINDNFDLKTSHVLPAMIRKFHEAKINNVKQIVLWGNGSPLREFLNVQDLARAVLFTLENNFDECIFNVGSGEDLSIAKLAKIVAEIIEFDGKIVWDKTMPNGTPRKLLDSSKFLKLGWQPEVSLQEGINKTYEWYIKNKKD
jgi:GDP-L-fucose synthase